MTQFDVIVVGAGASGIAAAISAARLKKSVLIIEKYGFTGGTATVGLGHHWDPVKIIEASGIAMEFYNRLKERNALVDFDKTILDMPFSYWEGGAGFDPEEFKCVCLDMLLEENVTCLFHSSVTDIEMEDNRIRAVYVNNKSGKQRYQGKTFIDCTGDGDLFALAGCDYEVGDENGDCMSPTLAFRLGGVDTEQIYHYFDQNPDQFGNHPRIGKYIRSYRESAILQGFYQLIEDAKKAGDLKMPMPESGLGMTIQPRYGEFHINGTRTPNLNPLDGESLSRLEILEREHIKELYHFIKKYIPGCENSYILQTADTVGIRESRRLKGQYVLTEQDIRKGTHFKDSIVRNKWAHFDVHSGKSMQWSFELIEGPYYIPLRCLLSSQVYNLAVAGRCISCTHSALASIRIIPIGALTGQAAGVAAAVSLNQGTNLNHVNHKEVIKTLQKNNVKL